MADACRHPEAEACREWAERWLSQSRFSSHLDLCNGNDKKTTVEKFLEDHPAPIDVEP